MKKFKGTKGQWSKLPVDTIFTIINDTGIEILDKCNKSDEEVDANIRLILNSRELLSVLQKGINIFEKAHEGCVDKFWSGFENGNGEEIGKTIDEWIKEAKKTINDITR